MEPQATLQQPRTFNGQLQTYELLYNSLKVQNLILHTCYYYDLFPTTHTLSLIAIAFHLFNSTLTNTSAKMNTKTITKKQLVDIFIHKN
jgi:hypothetical protein